MAKQKNSEESEEELSPDGQPIGLELDDLGNIAEPFDPEDIDVVTRPMTIDLLLSRIESKAINLQPDFQRRWGIWDQKRQSRLIESLLLRIPVPSLYAAEDANEDWEIVDGVQRLYTIAHFIQPDLINTEPLTLAELTTLKNFNNKVYDYLPPKLKRRLRETELIVHVIRKGTPPAVKYSIFERINTGSVVLSAQELRHAITPGRARELLEEWASSNEFKVATNNSIRPVRMGDRELVLRFAAFKLTPPTEYKVPNIDSFLLDAMLRLNTLSVGRTRQLQKDFLYAMVSARLVFGDQAFRKRYDLNKPKHPINKALFEAIAVNLSSLAEDKIENLIARKSALEEAFIELCRDREFESAISQGTGDINKVQRRFRLVADLFRQVLSDA